MIPWEHDQDFALQREETIMPETIIKEHLPATWRRWIYAAYAIIGVIIGATQVGFAAAELAQPVWLTVTLAVYAFVGGAVGLTATSHTPKSVEPVD
jgi:protein-S-isoprenylcysteine O-methyltransferase Ste14